MTDRQMIDMLIALAAAAAVGLVGGLLLRLRRASAEADASAEPAEPRWPWIAPLTLGLAYIAGHLIVEGPPRWPPINSESRIFFLAVGLTVVCTIPSLARILRPAAFLVLPIAAAAAPVAVLWPRLQGNASPTHTAWAIAAAAGAALTALCLIVLERQRWTRPAAVVLCGLAAALGAAILASHSLKFAQFSLGLAAAAGAMALLARPGAPRWLTAGGMTFGASMLAALAVAGGNFADLPKWSAATFAAAGPAALAAGLLWPKSGWPRILAAAIIAAAALAIAVIVNASTGTSPADYGGGEYPY